VKLTSLAHPSPLAPSPRLLVAGGLLAFCVLAIPGASRAQTPESDPKALAIADRVMEKLGGEDAWKATRFLRFDFAVDRGGETVIRRAHTWDRKTGRYRVEGRDGEGRDVVVLMSLWTRKGQAWVGGEPASGEELEKLLQAGYAWWTNDAYWLLMPYKMRDDGVTLSYAGLEAKQSGTWDKVLLTFENVGLTPKDRYWVFVNRKTDLVDRWEYILKGEDTSPTPWEWSGWKEYGDILLADDRVNPNDGTRIHFPVLDVPESLPGSVFMQP
jgi:hypothetical protein